MDPILVQLMMCMHVHSTTRTHVLAFMHIYYMQLYYDIVSIVDQHHEVYLL